jgi:glucose-6-phosphate dehydrogenase assembly protein OpcA
MSLRPERILKDLAQLWVDLAKEDTAKNSAGVLRACAMTLIVGVEGSDDAQAASQIIAELIHDHPSRAIVLNVGSDGGTALDARVFAQCWMPFGRRQQICCEEIEIAAPENLLADVPKLLLGLTVPDLPVILWVRCPRTAMHPEFQKIFPLANKIIVDSDCFEDSNRAYAFIADMNRRGVNMVDLAWTRLTHWRQMVAQMFEDERHRADLEKIRKVSIVRGGKGVGARYLASWFRHALPAAQVRFEQAKDAGLCAVELTGDGFAASIALEEGSCAVTKINKVTGRRAVPAATEHALLREELSILGVDPVFRRCFE